ncbi:MAG: rhombosortase [Steroidobacteraceae bacterium]
MAAFLVSLQAADWRQALEYRRAAVLRGELWRLVTGDVVHLGWVHLARDLAGLFLIWTLVGDSLDDRSWLWVLGTSGLAVGLGLLVFSPEISWYVGISGVLFGLFCAGALCQLPQRPIFAGVLLLGMATVVAWTLSTGALPSETVGLGGRVVPQAHLYGALGGAAVILVRTVLRTHWLCEREA